MQLQFLWFSSISCHQFFLQHCRYQHPPHEGCTSVLVVTPLALICIVQFIIHLNNKEYFIQILCNSIFLSILQIWQEQFIQDLVQKLDSTVHLHDLNYLLNAKSPSINDQNFRHPPPTIPPAICFSKNMPKIYLRHVK